MEQASNWKYLFRFRVKWFHRSSIIVLVKSVKPITTGQWRILLCHSGSTIIRVTRHWAGPWSRSAHSTPLNKKAFLSCCLLSHSVLTMPEPASNVDEVWACDWGGFGIEAPPPPRSIQFHRQQHYTSIFDWLKSLLWKNNSDFVGCRSYNLFVQ